MAIFPGSAIPSAVSDYTIDQSLRLNAADTPYLIRTPGTGNRRTWSVSFWAKLTKVDTSTYGVIWSACATAASLPGDVIIVETGDANWRFWIDNSSQGDRDIQAVARDPSAWYHVMCFFDSPNQTMGMYINGELQTDMRATGNPTLNYESDTFDGSTPIRIGEPASTRSGDDCLDCYVAEFHMVDGQALAASDFGETDSDTNQWVPKEYTGTYGDEGFYLKFSVSELTCDYLIVGGGARGDKDYGAWGGGGGGVQTDTDVALSAGTYSVVVGATSTGAGNNSSFNSVTANGGAEGTGQPGTGGASGAPQSNAGGTGHSASYAETGGAGGGAGAVGGNSVPSTSGGVGGVGIANDFHTGSNIMYGAGGSGGGTRDSSGGAAADGGGSGGNNSSAGTSPPANRGGGGGGNNSGSQQSGAAGVVVIRYKSSSQLATGGTVTSYTSGDDTYQVHTFTSNGSFVYDGGIGSDSSGNNNNFTVNNLVATDVVKDTPSNNFCTWNLISGNGSSLSEGNLKGVGQQAMTKALGWMGTIAPESGKWYWEVYCVTQGYEQWTGVLALSDPEVAKIPSQALSIYTADGAYSYEYAGRKVEGDGFATGSTASSYGNTWTDGDIIGIALDLDNGAIYFSKNGTWENSGDPTSGASKTGAAFTSFTGNYVPFSAGYRSGSGVDAVWTGNWGQDSSFAGAKTAQGNADGNGIGDFYYAVPSGFLAMCSSNLPEASIKLPGDHFNTVLYTGDGTVSRAITGVGFTPDMAVAKSRSATGQFMTVDNVRGMGTSQMKRLVWNNTYASQDATTNEWTSLDSDGFTFSNTSGSGTSDLNTDTVTFATWSWKAGGTPTADNSAGAGATPTAGSVKIDGSNLGSALAGSIPATRLSANTTNGFSIITWAGNGTSNSTIAHGLTQAPDLFISKPTDNGTDYWAVYVRAIGQGYLNLNVDGAYSSGDDRWGTNAPTATVMNLGYAGSTNNGSLNYVGFCWHSIEGYSKVGVYEGNGDPDGAFIYTGFRPAMVMVKDIDSSGNWVLMDNKREGYNVDNDQLYPNETDIEATNDYVDIVSNGFKFRSNATTVNTGETYLFYAVAAYPFKYANAR